MTAALGWLGTALVVASYSQSDVARLRWLSLAASVVLISFNVAIGVWSNVALEGALVAVNVLRLRRTLTVGAPVPDPDRPGEVVAVG